MYVFLHWTRWQTRKQMKNQPECWQYPAVCLFPLLVFPWKKIKISPDIFSSILRELHSCSCKLQIHFNAAQKTLLWLHGCMMHFQKRRYVARYLELASRTANTPYCILLKYTLFWLVDTFSKIQYQTRQYELQMWVTLWTLYIICLCGKYPN